MSFLAICRSNSCASFLRSLLLLFLDFAITTLNRSSFLK
jgi:hypothetical protein